MRDRRGKRRSETPMSQSRGETADRVGGQGDEIGQTSGQRVTSDRSNPMDLNRVVRENIASEGRVAGKRRGTRRVEKQTNEWHMEAFRAWHASFGEPNEKLAMNDAQIKCWWEIEMKTDSERIDKYESLKIQTEKYLKQQKKEMRKAVAKKARKIAMVSRGKKPEPEEGTVWTRCTPVGIKKLISSFSDEKWEVKEMGFGGLLTVGADIMHKKKLTKLLKNINTSTWELKYPGAETIKLNN